jgi:arylsulfatase A-like enzyme
MILVDDLDEPSMAQLPELRPLLQEAGTTFSRAYVSVALCCPSRTTILRGQYAHNTGVYGNSGKFGGYSRFVAMGDERSTVATWLQGAGYETAFFGKYMNGYPEGGSPLHIPVGWSTWFVPALGRPYSEYDYSINRDGRLQTYGHQPEDYFTDVMAVESKRFIHSATISGRPFFLYLNSYAPHVPETPAPRHQGLYPNARLPRGPAFNEEDLEDKPTWLRGARRLDAQEIADAEVRYRRRLQSMAAVQELIAGLIEQLRQEDLLDTTFIVFSSDNGYHFGEHRLPLGKNTPYETDVRVPLIIRGPGVPAGRVVDALTVNTDLAPTFAELAGASIPPWVDGRSLVPWLGEQHAPPWRTAFLMEHRAPVEGVDNSARRSSVEGLLEPPDSTPTPGTQAEAHAKAALRSRGERAKPKHELRAPAFTGLHTADQVYVEYKNGERELYDLRLDPHQLNNVVASTSRAELAQLQRWLVQLRTCVGQTCREAEDAPPPPAPPEH